VSAIELVGSSIELFRNRITDADVLALVDTLCSGRVIVEGLYLCCNAITDVGAAALSRLFQVRRRRWRCRRYRVLSPLPCLVTAAVSCHRYRVLSPLPCLVTAAVSCHRYRVLSPLPCVWCRRSILACMRVCWWCAGVELVHMHADGP
jgi:hypothetical protein